MSLKSSIILILGAEIAYLSLFDTEIDQLETSLSSPKVRQKSSQLSQLEHLVMTSMIRSCCGSGMAQGLKIWWACTNAVCLPLTGGAFYSAKIWVGGIPSPLPFRHAFGCSCDCCCGGGWSPQCAYCGHGSCGCCFGCCGWNDFLIKKQLEWLLWLLLSLLLRLLLLALQQDQAPNVLLPYQ